MALLLAAAPCGQALSEPLLFGYAAVDCGHDDPFDDLPVTDYSAEVAGFTSANQVCVTEDVGALATRLRRAAVLYRPVLYLEPVFFDVSGRVLPGSEAEALWALVRDAIQQSGVPPGQIIFYLADEPQLRGVPLAAVNHAARRIRRDFPEARVLVIEAFLPDRLEIPVEADLWGFNAYAIRDPGRDAGYVELLNRAAAGMGPKQRLAIVMDAQHTPVHRAAGLLPADMAEVAWNYHALATARHDVALLLGYSWAGGIDNRQERGVRDLPQSVIVAHRKIGERITGKAETP